jgi:murein DD-endopeptidase MepM/ murein hydrolase activator NlpD
VGATGHIIKRPGGSGAHLHFEVTNKRGTPINPFYLLKE